MIPAKATNKCSHPPCNCEVDGGQQFCGPICASEETPQGPCPCGHPECDQSAQIADAD